MILNMYSLKDSATGFKVPTTFDNDYVAVRQYKAFVKENILMQSNPDDFALYRIGIFDTDSGLFTQDSNPVLVCDNLVDEV